MAANEKTGSAASSAESQDPSAVVRELTERLDKAFDLIDTLRERTNTLTRLLDLVGRRLDRLERKE